jgi:hypothetical protein
VYVVVSVDEERRRGDVGGIQVAAAAVTGRNKSLFGRVAGCDWLASLKAVSAF